MHPHIYNLLRNRACFAPDGGGSGDPAPTPPAAPPAPPTPPPAPAARPQEPPEPETFSKEYVRELRAENGGWRLKAREADQKRQEAEDALKAAQTDADKKVTEANKAANDRIIRAELKAAAIKAGMVDLDGLKLADLSTVTLAEDGTVKGADEMLTALKTAKPYLFGAPGGTGNPNPPPPPKPRAPVDATKMTPEEYAAARKQYTRGR